MILFSLEPGAQGSFVKLNTIQDKLEGFRAEAEVSLPRLDGCWPAEGALFKALCGTPDTRAVEVEQLKACAGFVNEEVQTSVDQLEAVLVFDNGSEAVETFAKILRLEGQVYLEVGCKTKHSLRL